MGNKNKCPKNRFLLKTFILINSFKFKIFDYLLIIASIFLIFALSYLSFWLRNRRAVVDENNLSLLEPIPTLMIDEVKESTMSATEEDNSEYNKTTLQGFTTKDCTQLPVCIEGGDDCDTNGSTVTLTDTRDGKKYRVRRFQKRISPGEIGEGECWMIDNLDYEYKNSVDAGDNYGRFYSNEGLEDLCPIGWKIYDNDYSATDRIGSVNFIFSPKYFNAMLAGMVDSENKLHSQGEIGYLWGVKTAYAFNKNGIFNYNSNYPERMSNSPYLSSLSSVCSDSMTIDNKYPVRCYKNFEYE